LKKSIVTFSSPEANISLHHPYKKIKIKIKKIKTSDLFINLVFTHLVKVANTSFHQYLPGDRK